MKLQYKTYEINGYTFYINENVYHNFEQKINQYFQLADRFNMTLHADFVLYEDTIVKNRYGARYLIENFTPPSKISLIKPMETTMITACKANEIATENQRLYIENEIIPKYINIANKAVEESIKYFQFRAVIEIPPVDEKYGDKIAAKIAEYGHTVKFVKSSYDTDAYIEIKWD